MNKLLIAVICGGDSSEYHISILGARYIFQQLDKTKYIPYIVNISKKGWFVEFNDSCISIDKNDFSFIADSKKYKFEFAFINIHGTPGENGILQSYFELIDLPYSSCGVDSSVVTFNKMFSKRALSGSGINLAKDIILKKGDQIDSTKIIKELSLPIFVKPNASGSSFGVTKVKKQEELFPAIEEAYKESDTIIIEEFIEGREFSQGVYSKDNEIIALPLTEIVSKRDFFDYKAKYEGASSEITPAQIDENISNTIAQNAKDIYRLLDCRGYVRIDFIVNSSSQAYFIEVNSIPGMSNESIIPQQVAAAGMKMSDFLSFIIKKNI